MVDVDEKVGWGKGGQFGFSQCDLQEVRIENGVGKTRNVG